MIEDIRRRIEPINRRLLILGAASLAMTLKTKAAPLDVYRLFSDSGAPLRNQRVPSDLDPLDLPGTIRAGSIQPDVILVEFFDYNCPFCRAAAPILDETLEKDHALQLRIVNNPILSPQSADAAIVQQSVLRANGPQAAYAFHKKLLAIRGVADRESALGTAQDLGLSMDAIRYGETLPRVAEVLKKQTDRARTLGLTATPSFVLDGVEVLGWPGPKKIVSMIDSVRRCDQPACPAGSSGR